MKKTKIILLLVIILSLVSIAAAVEKRMGEQIEIVSANDGLPFDAHTPFHIAHGWSWYTIMGTANLNGGAPGRNQFTLEVDGEEQQFSFLEQTLVQKVEYNDFLWRVFTTIYVFNFPDGMEGTHTFTGKWWTICQDWYEICEKPNDLVVAFERTITVNFVEP